VRVCVCVACVCGKRVCVCVCERERERERERHRMGEREQERVCARKRNASEQACLSPSSSEFHTSGHTSSVCHVQKEVTSES